jgi:AI-2 transport protein TqsA
MQRPSILKPILILASGVILLAAMHLAASTIAPILFSLFIVALLIPIYRWLRRRIPAVLALLLSVGVLALVVLFLVLLVGNSLSVLFNSLAGYQETFGQRQDELEALAGGMGQTSAFQLLLSALDPEILVAVLTFFLGAVGSLFKNGLLILFVIIFVLGEGPQIKSRMIKIFGAEHYIPRKTITSLDMIVSYFGLRAIVNLIVAVCTAIMLWWFDIEYAGLWGVLIFFLSFIPYIGAFVSTIPPVLLAYAQGGLGLAIVIILFTIIINSLTENVVQPLVMGKGLSVSPTVVFLSFVFWMYILGGLGAFVAMPLTIAIILFMGEFEETSSLAELMGTFPEQADPS